MDDKNTLSVLSALAQSTRLEVFRLLVRHEPEGVAAGELARLAGTPQNTMSAHLAVLANTGLVSSQRHSRSVVYRADLARLREVIVYLLQDCCGGRPEICAPLLSEIAVCCPPRKQ